MKHLIFIEILKKIKSKPNFKRNIKIITILSLTGFIFIGGFTVLAGFLTYKYVATAANHAMTSPAIQTQLQNVKAELKQTQLNPLNCWNEVQSLMIVQPWLEKPVLDNLRNLKIACLNQIPSVCEGHECTEMKKIINTAKGEMI